MRVLLLPWFTLEQGCKHFLEGHSAAQFSSNQLQITPAWKFLVTLKTLIIWIRCVWLGLNCAELWPSRSLRPMHQKPDLDQNQYSSYFVTQKYYFEELFSFLIYIIKCNLFLWCTAQFSVSLLQCSVSLDLSEIILNMLIWCSKNISYYYLDNMS